MDAALLIGLKRRLNVNLIKILIDELATPLNDIAAKGRQVRVKNKNYVESIVPLYSDTLFKEHFRMSRVTFEILVTKIGNTMISGQNNPVDLSKKVMFTVWMLAKPESFLSVGDRFDIAKSSGHGIFREIIAAIVQLLSQYVKWPNPET